MRPTLESGSILNRGWLPRRDAWLAIEPFAITGGRRDRLVDPVYGMKLEPADVAARLDVGGETPGFCSPGCLQRFVVAPDRYTS